METCPRSSYLGNISQHLKFHDHEQSPSGIIHRMRVAIKERSLQMKRRFTDQRRKVIFEMSVIIHQRSSYLAEESVDNTKEHVYMANSGVHF